MTRQLISRPPRTPAFFAAQLGQEFLLRRYAVDRMSSAFSCSEKCLLSSSTILSSVGRCFSRELEAIAVASVAALKTVNASVPTRSPGSASWLHRWRSDRARETVGPFPDAAAGRESPAKLPKTTAAETHHHLENKIASSSTTKTTRMANEIVRCIR